MKLAIHLWLTIAVVIVFTSALILVRGQTGTTPATRARTDPVQREMDRKFEMVIIENALRGSSSGRAERYQPLVLEQIGEDFLRIQVVDRKVMHSVTTSDALDFELVAKSAAEIKKRAVRLKRIWRCLSPASKSQSDQTQKYSLSRSECGLRSPH